MSAVIEAHASSVAAVDSAVLCWAVDGRDAADADGSFSVRLRGAVGSVAVDVLLGWPARSPDGLGSPPCRGLYVVVHPSRIIKTRSVKDAQRRGTMRAACRLSGSCAPKA